MGVGIDEPGHDHEPVGVDHDAGPVGLPGEVTDPDHPTAAHADVGADSWCARAVDHGAASEEEIEHGGPSERGWERGEAI